MAEFSEDAKNVFRAALAAAKRQEDEAALAAAERQEDEAAGSPPGPTAVPPQSRPRAAPNAPRNRAPAMLKAKPHKVFDVLLPEEDMQRIRSLAAKHNHSQRDVVIWLLQRGIASLPKDALRDQ